MSSNQIVSFMVLNKKINYVLKQILELNMYVGSNNIHSLYTQKPHQSIENFNLFLAISRKCSE